MGEDGTTDPASEEGRQETTSNPARVATFGWRVRGWFAAPRRLRVAIAFAACGAMGLVVALIARARFDVGPAATAASDGRLADQAAIASPGARRSDGVSLSGTIVDGAGRAVAGAHVVAESETGSRPRAFAAPFAISSPTAADGRFALDGLAPGRYRLRVTGPEVLTAELRYVQAPADDARIVVSRRISIAGTVTDGGRTVSTATVAVLGDAIGGVLEVKADAKGAFAVHNLPEGHFQIYAWRAELAARAVRVSRFGAGPFAPLELRLEAAAIVVGTVVDRDEGTGVAAAVELRPESGDAPPRYARSGSNGVFRIEGVPSGRWIADAFAPGYVSFGGVEIDAGKARPELALQRGAAIEGRVLNGNGKPIAGATVRAFADGANQAEYSADVDLSRLRRFSGRTIAVIGDRFAATGDAQLIARGELGIMVGPIPPLPPLGAPIAPAAVVVDSSVPTRALVGDPAPLPTDPDRASVWITGDDGKYRIRGVPAGTVAVIASAPGLAETRSRRLTIGQAGEVVQKVDIVLSRGIFVVGKVTDQYGKPVIGAELSARPDIGAATSAFAGDDGRYRLGPLAGEIELRATAYGHAEVRRSVDIDARPSGGVADLGARGAAGTWTEDFVLEVADAMLAGIVVDVAGVPIGSAQLDVVGGQWQQRRATSSANGAFSIDKLPRGPLRVRIRHPDFPSAELDAIATTTHAPVRLTLASGARVEGAVVDGWSGKPLAGLTLNAAGPGGATAEASTDKAGRWRLGPLRSGQWKIAVKQPGYLSVSHVVDVPATSRPGAMVIRDVRIDLMRGALVGGTVRDGRGNRVIGARIAIRSQNGEALGESDARGEFRIHDAPTGDIVVSATRDRASGYTRASVHPGTEVLGLAIEIR